MCFHDYTISVKHNTKTQTSAKNAAQRQKVRVRFLFRQLFFSVRWCCCCIERVPNRLSLSKTMSSSSAIISTFHINFWNIQQTIYYLPHCTKRSLYNYRPRPYNLLPSRFHKFQTMLLSKTEPSESTWQSVDTMTLSMSRPLLNSKQDVPHQLWLRCCTRHNIK